MCDGVTSLCADETLLNQTRYTDAGMLWRRGKDGPFCVAGRAVVTTLTRSKWKISFGCCLFSKREREKERERQRKREREKEQTKKCFTHPKMLHNPGTRWPPNCQRPAVTKFTIRVSLSALACGHKSMRPDCNPTTHTHTHILNAHVPFEAECGWGWV